MKFAVVGDVGIDYYENLGLLKPGGIAFNLAYYLKKGGVHNISLISILGNERYSKNLLKIINSSKINFECIQRRKGNPPQQNILLENGERKFVGYELGVLKNWRLRKKDLQFIQKHDVVYVPLSDGMEQIFNTVKKLKGLIKAVDFSQDYEFADLDNKENIITRNSKYFDLIFAGGKKKHKKMIKNLAGKYPERVFVLTLGRNGSISFHNNKEFFEPAKNVKVVDTTGAGDAFQASFLSTWIRTKNIKESLKIGTLYASKIIQTVRSTPGISMVII